MEKLKLLFVCIENSNRSQMSQAFAKIIGGEQCRGMQRRQQTKWHSKP
jgi:protein-tyrosine-phosphatase